MTAAGFSLKVPALAHDDATALATAIEDDLQLDPLAVIINETDEVRGLWEVVLFFAEEADALAASCQLQQPAASVVPLVQQDWVRQSLEGLAPVSAGRFFLHGSHDRARRRAGGISLEIDAGTAFGTGHHGTTEGCLLALDALLKRGTPRRVLDVGCGTAVLAIAAARAGRRLAIASDIDPEAVRVAAANAALNAAGPLVRYIVAPGLKHRRIAQGAPYDLIFANILARPLVALARGLTESLAPGGRLILSGLTRDQGRWILATYRNHGLRRDMVIIRGNWLTLVLSGPERKKRPGGRDPGRFWSGTQGAGWEDA